MTIYLFCVNQEKRFKIKQMYEFVKDYFLDWFPKLPSYTVFATRLNRLSGAFKGLADGLVEELRLTVTNLNISLLCSIAAAHRADNNLLRQKKRCCGSEITDKG